MKNLMFVLLAASSAVSAAAGEPEAAQRRYGLIGTGGAAYGELRLLAAETPLVFYGQPGAAFSAQALEDISKAPAVYAALLARGLLLTAGENREAAAAWNLENMPEYRVLRSAADWPEIAPFAEPQILLYSGASAACALRGWAGAASLQELRGCLDKAGLLTQSARINTLVKLDWLSAAEDAWRKEAAAVCRAETASLLKEGAFAEAAAAAYGDIELKNAFELASTYNFHTPTRESLDAQGTLLAELARRGLGTHGRAEDFHDKLMEAREFARAEELRLANTGYALAAVPPIKGVLAAAPGEASLYALADGKEPMLVDKVKAKDDRIVIVGSPNCHFADAALEDLEKHPELGPVFRRHALLLSSRVDFRSIKKWNAAHALQYKLPARDADWPGLSFDSSPTFYFVKNGEVIHSAFGWSEEGNYPALYAGLEKLFPGLNFKNRPAATAATAKKERLEKRAARREGTLAAYLAGLDAAAVHRFCSGLRYADGVFAGAYLEDVRQAFGGARVEELETFLGGGGNSAAPAAGQTLGDLWRGLSVEELNRSCLTLSFYKGRFGGLNFGDLWSNFDESITGKTFAYFTPARKKAEAK